ncbi:Lysophospholipase, alpha-beta hydrolase superfamily [Lachnospiraceae bacterium YSD2013]|nr:Lysophospholipase, alpha-beta hydrolase superfamily [Lachnospiraceae bacterium YSD2013]
MIREDFQFESRDNLTKLHAVRWIPDDRKPKYILQIVHGMAEHVDRYEAFAEYMTGKGIMVTAEDHLGHGKSITDKGPGFFCKQDPATVIVRDVHRLKKMNQEAYPGVPYFILGHSMGSYMLRNYLCRYGKGIDGAIIMGTGMEPKFRVLGLKAIIAVSTLLGKYYKPCKLADKAATGAYQKRIKNPRTPFDWLTKDEAIVDKYIADPLCGFTFTGNGFKTLAETIWRLYKDSYVSKMPVTLRTFIISGSEDPVGNYGAGPKKVYESFLAQGMQRVQFKLYEGDRHEILNETDKETVYEDIYNWIVGDGNE